MRNSVLFLVFLLAALAAAPAYGVGTRFYLPSTGLAAVSPGFDGVWDSSTGSPDRIRCVTTKLGSAMTDKTLSPDVAIADFLLRQYVSDPIAAQTITGGTVKGQIRMYEGVKQQNAMSDILIKVVSNDGATVRGTLEALNTGVNELAIGALTNRYTPGSTGVTEVIAEDGDRIVFEIGIYKDSTRTTNLVISFGDDHATTDLGENETDTAAYNPWVEFSQTINFYTPPPDSKVMLICF